MRNHAKSFRSGGSWAGIETEGPERAAEPLIFPYDAWLGVSNFVVLATACFCNTLVIWLLQIRPVPRAIQNSSPSHVSTTILKLKSAGSLFQRSCQWLVKVTCEKRLKMSRLWDNGWSRTVEHLHGRVWNNLFDFCKKSNKFTEQNMP